MSLIIDGYNLLHTTMPPSLAGLDENRLCRLLVRGSWRGHVTVVCDGNPKPFALASPVPEVDLMYSGGRTADDIIEQLIRQDTSPRQLVVVSSDRQIQKAARRRRCKAVDCEQFVKVLARLAGSPAKADMPDRPIRGPLSEDEVQHWLEQFGLDDT